MTRIVMMGPPGVGKGTQAARLADALGVPQISTGDLFRAHVREETELGIQLKSIVEAGDYVPDSVTNDMVGQRLAEEDAESGFILDGYPRTTTQVAELDRILVALDSVVGPVVLLEVDTEEIVARLAARAMAQGRADDTAEVIRHRIDVYGRETAPLVAVYEERGCLVRIDGMGPPDEVAERVQEAVGAYA